MTNRELNTLIARVKAEAAKYAEPADYSDAVSDSERKRADGLTGGELDPAGQSAVDSLLTGDRDTFVDTAYRLLLRREADAAGRANYGGQLLHGVSRLQIAAKIRLSGEGRRAGAPLAGLRLAIVLAAADRVLRRIGLGALSARAQGRLDAAAERRAVKRTVVDWRRRFERVIGVVRHQESILAQLSQRVKMLEQQQPPEPPVLPEVIDTYYLAFEDANRGSMQDVLDKLAVYEDWLATCVPERAGTLHDIVDIGCGRGEWLSFVADRGHQGFGVDMNPVMIDACLAHGYKVRCTDALTFLRSLPSGSVAAVTGFHIIEHVPFDYLYAIVEESYRVLVEGGAVLFETPNPENVLVGSHTFYHDFTHRNPVTPTAISFLLKHQGFSAIDIIRSSPYPDEARVPGNDLLTERVNGHLCGPQDFAVTGRKANTAGRTA